jgi:hypothetical protein
VIAAISYAVQSASQGCAPRPCAARGLSNKAIRLVAALAAAKSHAWWMAARTKYRPIVFRLGLYGGG